MSLAREYYFCDNSGKNSDPNATAGDDNNDGTIENPKRTYNHALELSNTSEAGTIIYLGYSCGFKQDKFFKLHNIKAVTAITSLTFDGKHCICEILRPSNITVGQQTTIKGVSEKGFNGLVTCTEIIDDLTFKYLPTTDEALPAEATRAIGFDKMRCDAGEIKIKPYLATQFTPVNKTDPSVEYTDSTGSQHTFDNGTIQGINFDDITYYYTGPKQGKPNCFFIYRTDKESITLRNLDITGFRIGINPNNKIGIVLDLTVDNCKVHNNWSQGYLGGSEYSLVQYNFFGNNGHEITGGTVRQHNIYVSDTHYTTFKYNELTESAMNKGKATGTEFVVHGICSYLIIEDNFIHNKLGASAPTNYGIGVNSGYKVEEHFTNVIIRNNKIENCGKRSISCNAWIGGLVKENDIKNDQPDYTHAGIVFDKERNVEGTPTSDGVSIINNSISGSSIKKDIDIQAGTNFTIIRPDDIQPPTQPPIEPEKDLIEVFTTTEIKVNGDTTAKNTTRTLG